MDDMRKEFERMTTARARDVLGDDAIKVDYSLHKDGHYKDAMLQVDWEQFEHACKWQNKQNAAMMWRAGNNLMEFADAMNEQ